MCPSVDAFQINLALAGFAPEEITVTSEANELRITSRKAERNDIEYLWVANS